MASRNVEKQGEGPSVFSEKFISRLEKVYQPLAMRAAGYWGKTMARAKGRESLLGLPPAIEIPLKVIGAAGGLYAGAQLIHILVYASGQKDWEEWKPLEVEIEDWVTQRLAQAGLAVEPQPTPPGVGSFLTVTPDDGTPLYAGTLQPGTAVTQTGEVIELTPSPSVTSELLTVTPTPKPMLTPPATERVLELAPAELPPLDCRGLPRERCVEMINEKLEPLLEEDWGNTITQSYPVDYDVDFVDPYPDPGIHIKGTGYQNIRFLRGFQIYWDRPDGWVADEQRPDFIFALGVRFPNGERRIIPTMPSDFGLSAGRNAVGPMTFLSEGARPIDGRQPVGSPRGGKDILNTISPREVLFNVEIIEKVQKNIPDPVANLLFGQTDINQNDRIGPLRPVQNLMRYADSIRPQS